MNARSQDAAASGRRFETPHGLSEFCWIFIAVILLLVKILFYEVEEANWEDLQRFAWLVSGLIGFSYLFQVMTKRFVFFSARNLVLFGVFFWILTDVVQMIPQILRLRMDAAMQAMQYVLIFVIGVQAGYCVKPFAWIRRKFESLRDPNTPNLTFLLLLMTFCLGVFPYFYYSDWSPGKVVEGILSSRAYNADVGWRREILGDERVFVLALDTFFVIFPSLATFYWVAFKRHRIKKILMAGLILIVWVAEFFMGTRQMLGYVVLGPFLIVYLTLPKNKRRLLLFVFMFLSVILFFLMEIQVHQRLSGFFEQPGKILWMLEESRDPDRYLTIDDNFYQFARVVEVVPKLYPFVYFDELWYLVTRPVPRFLWEDKPTGFGLFYAEKIVGKKNITLTYSALGDFYVSFGVAGVIVGAIFFGMMARNVDQLISGLGSSKSGIALFTLCLLTLFIAGRSIYVFVVFGYYLFAFAVIVWLASFTLRKS